MEFIPISLTGRASTTNSILIVTVLLMISTIRDYHSEKDNKSYLDEDDYQEVITETAKNVSLNVSAIFVLAHTNIGNVPYSLEAALLSSAHIRFHTRTEEIACTYHIFCE